MKPESTGQEKPFCMEGTYLLGSDYKILLGFLWLEIQRGGVFFQGLRIPELTGFRSFVQFLFFWLHLSACRILVP